MKRLSAIPLIVLALACTKPQARMWSDIAGKVACAVARAELDDKAITDQCEVLWSDVSEAVLSTRRKVAAARQDERARAMAARCDVGVP